MQSIWYIPAGLDIWSQLLFEYPGRYALMKGVEVPENRPACRWSGPATSSHGLKARRSRSGCTTISSPPWRATSMPHMPSSSAWPPMRPPALRLRDQLLVPGLHRRAGHGRGSEGRNTGHKAIRARATLDLADTVGWERAHGVFYAGVPDMAVGPLYYSLYDAACVTTNARFPDGGRQLKKHQPDSTDRRRSRCVPPDRAGGRAKPGLGPGNRVSGGRQVRHQPRARAADCRRRAHLRWQTDPAVLSLGQHVNDYCNVVNYWFRTSDNPCQPRVLYLMAAYANDVARNTPLHTSHLDEELAEHKVPDMPSDRLLRELDNAIMSLEVAHSTALANAYLQSGADRRPFMATVALAACRFQDDPHNQKIIHSTFEEYEHNTTHLRDKLLLAGVRLLAGWTKMPGERDCFARFEREYNN